VPVCASEAAEGGNKRGEDADEDQVSAKGTDHVDEAENSHPELEESCGEETGSVSKCCALRRSEGLTETGIERRVLCSGGVGAFHDEGIIDVILRHHGEAECEPESTECAKDDEGEGVADNPL
jgi:hypothetical protein